MFGRLHGDWSVPFTRIEKKCKIKIRTFLFKASEKGSKEIDSRVGEGFRRGREGQEPPL